MGQVHEGALQADVIEAIAVGRHQLPINEVEEDEKEEEEDEDGDGDGDGGDDPLDDLDA